MADAAAPARMITLAEALARLPLESPDSCWLVLADRLAAQQSTRRRRPRWPFAIAAAAALLAIALLPRHVPVAAVPASTAGDGAQLSALMTESSRLERLLGAARDDGASSASAAAMSLTLEDNVSALDAQLQAGNIDPTRQLALWQRRILLLREAASLEASRHYLAANGQNLDVALVAAY